MDSILSVANNSKTKENGQEEQIASKEIARSVVPEYLKVIGMDPRKFWPKKYRFTRESTPGQLHPLSTSQRNFYESNGYIVIDEAVSPKMLQAVRSQYHDNWRRGAEQIISPTNLIEPKSFNNFVTSPNLLMHVGSFTDEQILLMSSSLVNSFKVYQFNDLQEKHKHAAIQKTNKDTNKTVSSSNFWGSNKDQQRPATLMAASSSDQQKEAQTIMDPPNKSQMAAAFENRGYQFLYRDWMYLPFRPIDKIVCTVTALEPIDQVLLVVPGTHRVGQCTISTTSNGDSKMNEVFESAPVNMGTIIESAKKQSKYINLKAGQTLFYSPGLVHGYSNDLVHSNKNYLAVISYYASGDCKYIDYEPSKDLIDHRSLPVPVGLADFGLNNPADYIHTVENTYKVVVLSLGPSSSETSIYLLEKKTLSGKHLDGKKIDLELR